MRNEKHKGSHKETHNVSRKWPMKDRLWSSKWIAGDPMHSENTKVGQLHFVILVLEAVSKSQLESPEKPRKSSLGLARTYPKR